MKSTLDIIGPLVTFLLLCVGMPGLLAAALMQMGPFKPRYRGSIK